MAGIDVIHPGMGTQEGTPSIAAVAVSIDKQFVQFLASLRIQEVLGSRIRKLHLFSEANAYLCRLGHTFSLTKFVIALFP